ncbi:hypothetical protein [Marilutibacter chinensis]|uniref:Uncharacterized protein n=1 Tax=Marilutibacter chinensis TaxID=2912247 RepID=A0ABS9HVH6_9GAMM|nr:hypothetical protein [Lysobacter chinensis]MCF7222895.1 hypothetical protein [Lysobacter chinensis]
MAKRSGVEARRRRRRVGSGCLLALAALSLAGAAFAQARPVTTYRGTVGDSPVELLLIHDWQLDGMGGYLFDEAQRMLLPLEKTPYAEDESLLINVLGDPMLPTSVIAFRPFVPGAKYLRGRSIDLRSREQKEVSLQRVMRFSSDPRDAYTGDLLQGQPDDRFHFRVHARKARGEHAGRVDAITVFDRASGEPVQVLDGLDLFFSGTDTLQLDDFNDDGIVDFSVMPMRADDATRTGEHRHYFVYRQEAGGYARDPQLEALAAQGALEFGSGGRVSLRPESGVDYRAGTIQWRHYRFVAPDRLELQSQSEERF